MIDLNEEVELAMALLRGELELGLDPEDEDKRESFELAIYWLSKIYAAADWGKIARSRNVYAADVFEHRFKAALAQRNMRRVNDALCCSLGLQSIHMAMAVLDKLETNRNAIMTSLRKEPIYFTVKAIELAARMKEERQEKKNGQ